MRWHVPIVFATIIFASCSPPPSRISSVDVIPSPVAVERISGHFVIGRSTVVIVERGDASFEEVAAMARGLFRLEPSNPGRPTTSASATNVIVIRQRLEIAEDEGYRLEVTPNRIAIDARSAAGAFYGLQTLQQLLPADMESGSPPPGGWPVPAVLISDSPRYPYRGMHLDVSRHFFPVEFIKRYIDLLAMHKMNRFHWHLTDDQGWRIEIKRFPRLAEVGGWRNGTLIGHYGDVPHRFDTARYGGYYTQDEIREVVRYAQDRFVTIVPEIEMPGHALAALSAYPELSCTGGPFESAQLWGVFDDIFCTKDSVFTFLEGVLSEVIDLFPGTYIHIGGDEAPKTRWSACPQCTATKAREGLKDDYELQSYFVRRIERFLSSRGRKLIGWDEILEGGLAPDATVMSWRGTQGGIDAARLRHDVIMTPGSHCYFDYYQSRSSQEPVAIGGFTTLEKVYAYEPTPPELTAEEATHILGAQGNVWTEYMANGRHVEYMAYPRAIALAEVLWSRADHRDFNDFADRLAVHSQRLDRLNVNYANHLFDVRALIGPADKGVTLSLSSRYPDVEIRYTSDGTEPTARSPLFDGPISVTSPLDIRAAGFKDRTRATRIIQTTIDVHLATGKPIAFAVPPGERYAAGGRQALVNGIRASDERYDDGEWLGWSEADCEATVDLLDERPLTSLELRFFQGIGQWIWRPQSVEVQVSNDGAEFRTVATTDSFDPSMSARILPVRMALTGTIARYVRVVARRFGPIPAGNPGAGRESWLFVDEITIR